MLLAAGLAGFWGYYDQPDQRLARATAQVQIMLTEQRYSEAADLLRALEKDTPDSADAARFMLQAGDVSRIHLDQPERALLDYLLVIRDYDGQAEADVAQRRIADLYFERLNDYPRAITAYHELLERDVSGGDQLRERLGEAYFRLNNFEQACIEWQMALESYPDSPLIPRIRYRIAHSQALQGRHKQAIELFRDLIEDFADHPYGREARFGLAAVLEEEGHLREALDELQRLNEDKAANKGLQQRIEQVRARIDRKKDAI